MRFKVINLKISTIIIITQSTSCNQMHTEDPLEPLEAIVILKELLWQNFGDHESE